MGCVHICSGIVGLFCALLACFPARRADPDPTSHTHPSPDLYADADRNIHARLYAHADQNQYAAADSHLHGGAAHEHTRAAAADGDFHAQTPDRNLHTCAAAAADQHARA